jgi:hypothetical protein
MHLYKALNMQLIICFPPQSPGIEKTSRVTIFLITSDKLWTSLNKKASCVGKLTNQSNLLIIYNLGDKVFNFPLNPMGVPASRFLAHLTWSFCPHEHVHIQS